MYYDINKTLSYNCLFNIIIGNRGSGKTYGAKKRAIKNFLKNGSEFIYLRRYETELKKVKEPLFNDINLNGEYEDVQVVFKNDKYFIGDSLIGYAMPLTQASYYKSSSFPKVTMIVYDECIIDDSGTSNYLPNEVEKFLDFYQTIARDRPVIVFFLSNAISFINPYTNFWNLRLPYGSNIIRKDDILLELVQNQEFINHMEETRFGKLIKGTRYAEYSIKNKFLRDSNTFIEKKTGNCHYSFTFKYMGTLYGVWGDYGQGKLWVSDDIDPSCKLMYSITLDDHNPNTLLLKQLNRSPLFKIFIDAFKQGNVYFESLKIKSVVFEVIKMSVS